MAVNYKMKMLWHHAYWDNPLSGLGEYNGQKVWFQVEQDEILEEDKYTPEIKEMIKNHQFNEEDDDCIGSTDDYEVFYYPEYTYSENYETKTIPAYFSVRHKLSYKMYRLPDNVLERVQKDFDEMCDLIGYGCWHDPDKFKPCYPIATRMKEYTAYYEKQKTNPSWIKINRDELEKYECIGTVKYDEIQWFQKPSTGKACFASQSEQSSPSSYTNLMPKACMDNLPIELLQEINDQLDFFDQIKFKGISKWFHDNIRIKQVIPYILIRKHVGHGAMDITYYVKLDKLAKIIERYSQEWISNNDFHDICILIPNKPSEDHVSKCVSDFILTIHNNQLYTGNNPFNLRITIIKCLEVANRILTLDNVI